MKTEHRQTQGKAHPTGGEMLHTMKAGNHAFCDFLRWFGRKKWLSAIPGKCAFCDDSEKMLSACSVDLDKMRGEKNYDS